MNDEEITSDDNDDVADREDPSYLVAALLVIVAKGDGEISSTESEEMMALMEADLGVPAAQALAFLRQAIDDFVDTAEMNQRLSRLGAALAAQEQEDIAVMLLKVVAADGRKDAAEMDKLRSAAETVGIPDDVMHRAFDRYFEETQTIPPEDI